jgi:hypothetical protein
MDELQGVAPNCADRHSVATCGAHRGQHHFFARDTRMATTHTPDLALPRTPTAALVNRIKAEYIELPGLQLTPWQAQRLWGLDQVQCDAILEVLVETAFLRKTKGGAYAIADR